MQSNNLVRTLFWAKNGVTVNWIAAVQFERPLSEMPTCREVSGNWTRDPSTRLTAIAISSIKLVCQNAAAHFSHLRPVRGGAGKKTARSQLKRDDKGEVGLRYLGGFALTSISLGKAKWTSGT